jgi:predicted ATPase with chaperone activity
MVEDVIEPEVSPRDLPPLLETGGGPAPRAPSGTADAGVDLAVLRDLALKTAYTAPNFTTEWAARRLSLPQPVVGELLEQLRADRLLDILGQAGPLGYRYAVSQPGRERAARLLEISGYVGPAPVSLESYTALLEYQIARFPAVSEEDVSAALAELVLPEGAVQAAALAASSGRSLFVFGPPGNGKTSLGRALHNAQRGDLWVPRCINIESNIIRVFDPRVHQEVDEAVEQPWMLDHRWVKIRRPFVVLGGETTFDSLDLAFSPALRYYEAPLHLKANGGTLLIDDFGRQRVDPVQLLNRWIIPLEHQIDYLALHTGQQIQVPFRQLLIIATNLNPEIVTDPAFLRRMGYRLSLDRPTGERYSQIFQQYANRRGVSPEPALVARLIDRYRAENRELRCCEPRDLIERARDICQLQRRPLVLDEQVLDLAWARYFGAEQVAGSARG